jgi:hypothetical protein
VPDRGDFARTLSRGLCGASALEGIAEEIDEAAIMPEPIQNLLVKPGCLVEVELLGQTGQPERLTFTLVDDSKADFDAGFLGINTPLAKTILGKMAGVTLPYRVGDMKAVKILSVQAHGREQTEDVAARREAVNQKAVKHSDSVNAMIFAGAVNSKWGDYDFDKLDPAQWETDENQPPEQKKEDRKSKRKRID